jgi:hypothetical protein
MDSVSESAAESNSPPEGFASWFKAAPESPNEAANPKEVKDAPQPPPQPNKPNTPLEKVLAALNSHGKNGTFSASGEWIYRCPGHDDHKASLSVRAAEDGKVLLTCFVCGDDKADKERILQAIGLKWSDLFPTLKTKDNQWFYETADKSAAFLKTRETKSGEKTYYWFKWNASKGKGKWEKGTGGETPPLYKLPQLLDAIKREETIHITEGEKCAEALMSLGFTATTSGGGAGNTSWLTPAFLEPLRGADVVLWPDCDEPGRRYVETFAKRLQGIAKTIRLIKWSADRPPKYDVADFIEEGATKEIIDLVVEESVPYVAPVADETGVLIQEAVDFINEFVYLSQEQALACALWTLHTWSIDAADVTPYINIEAPEKESGKTRLLLTLKALVKNEFSTLDTSRAYIYRKVNQDKPTLLIDEVDTLFGPVVNEGQETMRGILNAGFERGMKVGRVVDGGRGGLEDFEVFCPKAFAGIGKKLPDTVRSRSITIEMKRKPRNFKLARFRRRDQQRGEPLRRRFETWAETNTEALLKSEPIISETDFKDRQADLAEPLLAIADLAGGSWGIKARSALITLFGKEVFETATRERQILEAVRRIVRQRAPQDIHPSIFTYYVLARLLSETDSPWHNFYGREPINVRGLHSELLKYNLEAKKVRIGRDVRVGYIVAKLEDTFTTWLSPYEEEEGDQDEASAGNAEARQPPPTQAGMGLGYSLEN